MPRQQWARLTSPMKLTWVLSHKLEWKKVSRIYWHVLDRVIIIFNSCQHKILPREEMILQKVPRHWIKRIKITRHRKGKKIFVVQGDMN